jgi:hypothetical protein
LVNFEQKVILQPVYNDTFSSGSYSNTLRGALSNTKLKWTADYLIPDWTSTFNPETVDIMGTELNFQGSDLGNVPQRMNFIDNIADAFLDVYNKPTGYGDIVKWHRGL